MIEIDTRIHDRYSIELKVGFVTRKKLRMNDFSLAMWFFVPGSLDINRATYPKDMFYQDVKSNIRLITPVFLLREIVEGPALPLRNIREAFIQMASNPTRTLISEYEYQIKMFAAIVKSALRDELAHIKQRRRQEFACSLLLARRILPLAPSHKLGDLVRFANLPAGGRAHRALADAEMAASLLHHLEEQLCSRFQVKQVSHELLRRIQSVPKAKLEQCLQQYQNNQQ